MAGQTPLPITGDTGGASCSDNLEYLADVIQAEILPRLILAHSQDEPLGERDGWQPEQDAVEEFAMLTLNHDHAVARSFIRALRETGVSLEDVLLKLMGPAARYLGELWRQDLCTFTDVTIGLGTMHALLRELCPDVYRASPGRRALLVPLPGEQHAFGVRVVAELARLRGWEIEDEIPSDDAQVVDWVRDNWFETVGLSVSSERKLEGLATLLGEIRSASRNPAVKVLVGGQIFSQQPDLAQSIGADATALDALEAIETMNRFATSAVV